MSGKGNIVGFLGEIIIHEYFKYCEFVDSYDYDLILCGERVEVKTKTQNVDIEPLPYYECSVASQSLHQEFDYYIFCRIYKNNDKFKHGWIIGTISKEDFFKKSRFLKKGEFDDRNNYTVRNDCYNLEYKYLRSLR